MNTHQSRSLLWFLIFTLVSVAALAADRFFPGLFPLPNGMTSVAFVGLLSAVLAAISLFNVITFGVIARKKKPAVEGVMISRLYWLLGFLGIIVSVCYAFRGLKTFGAILSMFAGMFLGWSLQAPVSGFAAYLLVSLKRPFRPGDRVQFPNLGLTGDIKEIGAMYTVLDQVGGTIGSEEAVGRFILVPNAMLFSQVAINYTVSQDASYMLDEVVIRITFDADWAKAEEILLRAANDVTRDIIEATGEKPYIRADPYDYGVYLRLRYKTRVQDRVEISYNINKLVFQEIQHSPSVDLAIPFIYSNRVGHDRKVEDRIRDKDAQNIVYLPVDQIRGAAERYESADIELLTSSIRAEGLLQPIIVAQSKGDTFYDILAGHLRFEVCKKLGWKSIPAIIRTDGGNHHPTFLSPHPAPATNPPPPPSQSSLSIKVTP